MPSRSVFRVLATLALLAAPPLLHARIPAFPGAEGFGAHAAGGRGGDVYTVTNLEGSGPGSFADAIATAPDSGRTIVFAVSGYIPVPGKNLRVTKPRITVAGQTAPGGGIGFRDGTVLLSAEDIVIRHVRFRHGKGGAGGDCVNLDEKADRAILDHVTMQFSTDENMSSFKRPPDHLTLQYSINAWGLQNHSCGGLWDQKHATALYTLWAHNHTRNPKARPLGLLEWVNNVTFDWDIGFILGDSRTPMDWRANVVGNYFICPPGNLRPVALEKARLDREGKPNFTLHVADNLFDKNGNSSLDGEDLGHAIASGVYTTAAERLPADGSTAITPVSPRLAYKKIVSAAGPLRLDARSPLPLRDEVDTLLIDNLVNLRRGMIASEADLPVPNAGFGTLETGRVPRDIDRDGMPDGWELALGGDPRAQDHNVPVASADGLVSAPTFFPAGTPAGYTRLEEYLHFLASPHVITAHNTAASAAPSSVVVDLSRYTLGFNSLAPAFTLSDVLGGGAAQSGPGGRLVTFTPAPDTAGRARFEFTVTDSQGDAWTRSFLVLIVPPASR